MRERYDVRPDKAGIREMKEEVQGSRRNGRLFKLSEGGKQDEQHSTWHNKKYVAIYKRCGYWEETKT